MMCTQIEDTIKELLKIEGVTIVGPDFTDPNKLRVYADGGKIGKIFVGRVGPGKHDLISPDYYNYYKISSKKLEGDDLETIVLKSIDPLKTLSSPDYINKAKIAINKKNGDEERIDESVPSERHVETSIVKKFMKNENVNNWAVVDMEVQFPRGWFRGNKFSSDTTGQPRFDIVVVDRQGIGFLELKVNNENVKNIRSHYEHMEFILERPEIFMNEIKRRMKIIKPYDLINKSLLEACENAKNLWCGFLFVGGDLDKAQNLVSELSEEEKIDDFKFLYYEDMEDFSFLDINNAVSYKDFVPPDYKDVSV